MRHPDNWKRVALKNVDKGTYYKLFFPPSKAESLEKILKETDMTVTADETGAPTTFSEELRAASWGAHERAAESPFMVSLMSGDLDRSRYADMVAQHYFAYLVLEEAAEAMASDPAASMFHFPELTRVPALESDLEFLLGEGWRDQISPSPATTEYCDHMREVCFNWPGGFVAHHYVRYLGDLSGGQFIKRKVKEIYDLPGTSGIDFYEFSEIPKPTAFKDEYRSRLDRAPWDAEEQRRIIDEILLGYELNTKVLDQLS